MSIDLLGTDMAARDERLAHLVHVAIVANDNAGYRLISTTGAATSFGER